MALNRIRQGQIKSNNDVRNEFATLEEQLSFMENRTRVIARITHDTKTQWDTGTKENIDTDTYLDQIQLSSNNSVYSSTGTFISYVLDFGAYNIKFSGFDYTHYKPAGTNITYYTRSGDYQSPDDTWTAWETVTVDNKIQSPNARFIQFKVVLSTNNNTISPRVMSIAVGAYASAGTQELFDARAGYASINDRIESMSSVYHLKVIPANDQTDINLNKLVPDSTILKVYLNGQLQSEGDQEEDSYEVIGSQVVRFKFPLTADDLVIVRIEGSGSGVVTVKENRIVGEVPTTSDRITYTLSRTPIPDKEEVMVEGIRLTPGADNDYTLDGNQIIFNYTINTSFVVRVNYLYY